MNDMGRCVFIDRRGGARCAGRRQGIGLAGVMRRGGEAGVLAEALSDPGLRGGRAYRPLGGRGGNELPDLPDAGDCGGEGYMQVVWCVAGRESRCVRVPGGRDMADDDGSAGGMSPVAWRDGGMA